MPAQQEQPAQPVAPKRRDVITPYAFQVHPALLGLPLAQPWRRAVAIAIDGVFIGLLALVPNPLLVLVTGGVAFRWAGKTQHPWAMRRRGWLRGGAVVLFLAGALALWAGFSLVVDDDEPGAGNVGQDLVQAVEIARLAINVTCRDLDCARGPLLKFAELAGRQDDLDEAGAWKSASEIFKGLNLSDADTEQLHKEFLQRMQASRSALVDVDTEPPPGRARQAAHSVIEWARGLLDDLGIGLGWAALYFTVFSAWWNGQTPGKKLLGIRVVQLDGTPITLWEAFERCGGYGAGLATGLLGFIQVWWDPNRQAIHDKIAETVVIRGELPE